MAVCEAGHKDDPVDLSASKVFNTAKEITASCSWVNHLVNYQAYRNGRSLIYKIVEFK